jgi:uncharacterized membrane protein (DUF106 family)
MFEQIFAAINSILDIVFSPVLAFSPIVSLVIISTALTVLVLVINKIFINTKVMREIKEKMEEIREKVTTAQKAGNKDEAQNSLNEMMKINSQYMKHSMKAMVISIVVLGLFLPWLKYRFGEMPVAYLPFSVPFVGASLGWLWWYVIVSFAIGWVLRKLLVMDYA